ncbi:MAG TPA: LysR family transcriptional regulator [Beijerinckiaceae bacterium]|jgi:DNA-binding transcriptional LysR family regulator
MDLFKAMESFVRTARAGSFARAASQSGMSRAIVSKHIQDLEDYLGARLFHRTTRRLSLTEVGREYQTFCARLLDDMAEQREAVRKLQQTACGSIKLMAPKSFGNIHLSAAIAEFVEKFPGIHVSMLLADDPKNSHHLVENGLDLAVRLSPISDSSLVSRRIGSLRWLLCCSPGYIERSGAPAGPEDLVQHNCLLHLRTNPDNAWTLSGPRGDVVVEVGGSFAANSSLALRSAALRGLGIAFLPAYCVSSDLASGRLVEVLRAYPVAPRAVYLLYPHRRHLPAKVRLLIDFLVERFSRDGWDDAAWEGATCESRRPGTSRRRLAASPA